MNIPLGTGMVEMVQSAMGMYSFIDSPGLKNAVAKRVSEVKDPSPDLASRAAFFRWIDGCPDAAVIHMLSFFASTHSTDELIGVFGLREISEDDEDDDEDDDDDSASQSSHDDTLSPSPSPPRRRPKKRSRLSVTDDQDDTNLGSRLQELIAIAKSAIDSQRTVVPDSP